jgi:hypothetical protein
VSSRAIPSLCIIFYQPPTFVQGEATALAKTVDIALLGNRASKNMQIRGLLTLRL